MEKDNLLPKLVKSRVLFYFIFWSGIKVKIVAIGILFIHLIFLYRLV